jgi:glucose dehydrogenase
MRGGTLLCVVVIDDQASVNDTRNPTEQSQKEAQEKTGNSPRQQDGKWRQYNAEKISQRFHFFFRFPGSLF